MNEERPIVFECEGDRLVAVLHEGAPQADIGIVIVVGGPQHRVGSHRQFVLMARRFAAVGIPVLRFDVRGMGDSEGRPRSFEVLDADIHAAIDAFMKGTPRLDGIVLLGLCDAASANLIYGYSDPRVRGLILMNPWVRTAQGEAKAYLRHYYLQRLLQKSLWRKILTGKFSVSRSLRGILSSLRLLRSENAVDAGSGGAAGGFIDRMRIGLSRFCNPTLIVISGRDLTAQEFMDLVQDDRRWQKALKHSASTMREFAAADHTFSDESSLDSVSACCLEWVADDVQAKVARSVSEIVHTD